MFGWRSQLADMQVGPAPAPLPLTGPGPEEGVAALQLPPTLDHEMAESEGGSAGGLRDVITALPADLNLDIAGPLSPAPPPATTTVSGSFGLPPPRTAASPPPFPGGLFPMPAGSTWQPQAPPQVCHCSSACCSVCVTVARCLFSRNVPCPRSGGHGPLLRCTAAATGGPAAASVQWERHRHAVWTCSSSVRAGRGGGRLYAYQPPAGLGRLPGCTCVTATAFWKHCAGRRVSRQRGRAAAHAAGLNGQPWHTSGEPPA